MSSNTAGHASGALDKDADLRNGVKIEFPHGGPQDLFYSPANKGDLPNIVRAKGIYMWDEQGHCMIDVSSGPIISNIGHGDSRIGTAMARQVEQLDFAYSRVARHPWNAELADKIIALAGAPFGRVAFASGGSEAMEVAIKFARQLALPTDTSTKRSSSV